MHLLSLPLLLAGNCHSYKYFIHGEGHNDPPLLLFAGGTRWYMEKIIVAILSAIIVIANEIIGKHRKN